MTGANGKLARWSLRLASLDHDVVHRAGVKHQADEALSRLETTKPDEQPIDDDLPLLLITMTGESAPICYDCDKRGHDTFIPEFLSIYISQKPPTLAEIVASQADDEYSKHAMNYVGMHGSLFQVNREGSLVRVSKLDGAIQVFLQKSLQDTILRLSNYSLLSGHPGARRM